MTLKVASQWFLKILRLVTRLLYKVFVAVVHLVVLLVCFLFWFFGTSNQTLDLMLVRQALGR